MGIEFNPDVNQMQSTAKSGKTQDLNNNLTYQNSPIFDHQVIGKCLDLFIKNADEGKISKDKELDITGEEWRDLANKKDKTNEENTQMVKEYKDKFLLWGQSYVEYLDKKYGNGDNVLTKKEFIDKEIKELLEEYDLDDEQKAQYYQLAENMVTKIDINGNGEIDVDEMAALLAMFDMDNNTGAMNGKIKVSDMEVMASHLPDPETEKDGANLAKRLKTVYEMFFKPGEK